MHNKIAAEKIASSVENYYSKKALLNFVESHAVSKIPTIILSDPEFPATEVSYGVNSEYAGASLKSFVEYEIYEASHQRNLKKVLPLSGETKFRFVFSEFIVEPHEVIKAGEAEHTEDEVVSYTVEPFTMETEIEVSEYTLYKKAQISNVFIKNEDGSGWKMDLSEAVIEANWSKIE